MPKQTDHYSESLEDGACFNCGFIGKYYVRGEYPHNVYSVCPNCDARDSQIIATRKELLKAIKAEDDHNVY